VHDIPVLATALGLGSVRSTRSDMRGPTFIEITERVGLTRFNNPSSHGGSDRTRTFAPVAGGERQLCGGDVSTSVRLVVRLSTIGSSLCPAGDPNAERLYAQKQAKYETGGGREKPRVGFAQI
jgi:hypothetical protein